MKNDDFPVCCIHSGMEKEEREETYKNFKNGKHRVCISSNVTARGIDIQQVSTVINFDIPKCVHTYLHRIGRSGRWGRKGVAINFVTKYDIHLMKGIEQLYETEIKELTQKIKNLIEENDTLIQDEEICDRLVESPEVKTIVEQLEHLEVLRMDINFFLSDRKVVIVPQDP